MRVQPEVGVTADILKDGFLELCSTPAGIRYRCGQAEVAMWIALRQHDGQPEVAADMLAKLWGTDPANMRVNFSSWINELRNAGLVRVEP
ncbi:PqqD family protein [Kitasatospora sp. NPDC086801]|uniref:PqqD family protein n=1 Tax=Kitasatospora sp. NPDC086801 TaxID=3364066 RepID=UPI00383088CC